MECNAILPEHPPLPLSNLKLEKEIFRIQQNASRIAQKKYWQQNHCTYQQNLFTRHRPTCKERKS